MIRKVSNISTSASEDRQASEERSLGNSSPIANNPTTAINPVSPAHDSKRGKAVVEYSCIGNSVGTYILQGRRAFRKVFTFEIPTPS